MDESIQGGATLWARQTIESEIFKKPAEWFKIWFYLVNRTSHKDTKQYKRGEAFLQTEWIGASTGASVDQIKKCLSWLRENDMISTRRSTRGIFIKVLKYDFFQRLDNYYVGVKAPTQALEKHQRSTTINKNEKNKSINTLTEASSVGDTPLVPFDQLGELKKFSESPRRDVRIAALYMKRSGLLLPSKAIFQKEFLRAMKEIKTLKDFDDRQILEAMNYCEENYQQWTLETVGKTAVKQLT